MHSFLLIGQSNMAGRGFLKDAVEVDTKGIYILRNGRWQEMFRPINPDRSFSGSNLAEHFAELYVQKHHEKVGLVCCADGGTCMDQWMPGSLLYDNAVFNAKQAMRTSSLAGILWHQGESDCDGKLHPSYKEKLTKMLTQLRKDLGLPNVPIVLGGLGDFLLDCRRPNWPLENYPFINAAAQSVANHMNNVAFVTATGLTANPDNLHFNAASLYEFGQRYFDAFEKLIPITSAAVEADTQRSEMEKL